MATQPGVGSVADVPADSIDRRQPLIEHMKNAKHLFACVFRQPKCQWCLEKNKDYVPVHSRGTDMESHILGSEMDSVRLMGRLKGTFPVSMRQAQSLLLLTTAPSALQQSSVGDPPPLVLPVM